MKIKGYYWLCCIFFVLMTTVSSYSFGGDAVFKMQVVQYSSSYNTGRMYCETPIKVLVDNPTQGATSLENMIYFMPGEISPINNRYTNFRPNPKLLSNILTGTIKNGNTLRFGLYGSSSSPGNNLLLGTFRVISNTGITTTTLQYSGNNLIEKAGGGSLFSGSQNLIINFATGPCLIDNQGPIISIPTISNGAYRVETGQDIVFTMNDQSGIGKHYRYLTTNYSSVSGDNYVADYSTGDNQYGVNSGSIGIKIGSTVFSLGNSNVTLTATGKTRALLDRGYTGIIYATTLPSFGKEQAMTITSTGRDNLNNLSTSTITFNNPRTPFIYRTGIATRNGGTTISTPYSNRSPNTSINVYPFLNTITFATLDDRAGVDSGSLNIIIKTGSIAGGTIWSGNISTSGIILSGLTYSYISNGMNGSNPITHNNNYEITRNIGGISGFNLPYNTEIYVIVSGYDLANTPQAFIQTGFANDQNNYFHFTTRNSCIAMQCIDWIRIDTGSNEIIYTGTDLVITGGNNPYISGNTLYCSIPTIGIDIQTGGTIFYTGYTGNTLEIQPTVQSGFTTYLSGYTIYIKKFFCGDGMVQTPNRSGDNEQCDDGNNNNSDGCNILCQIDINPTATVLYTPTSGTRTSGNVLATLTGFSEPLTGINFTGHIFTGNGILFTFTFSDLMGNTGNVTATVTWIDKIPPTFSGATSGVTYATGVTLYFADNNSGVTATLNGTPYTNGTTIINNGTYTLFVKDIAGNSTGMTCIIQHAICGNGIVEGGELYDNGVNNGSPGYSNTTCNGLVGQSSGNGGGGGGNRLTQDSCPNGDLSPSYYDNSCNILPGSHTSANCRYTKNELSNAYDRAYNLAITTVSPICDANLDGKITRKQLAKMMTEFTVKIIGKQPNTKILCSFGDTKNENTEMKFYIKTACQLGLMGRESNGVTTKKKFDPNSFVSRAEFGTVLSRLIFQGKYNTSDSINRYKKHLDILQKISIMIDINKPTMKELRGYILLMMKRTNDYIKNTTAVKK